MAQEGSPSGAVRRSHRRTQPSLPPPAPTRSSARKRSASAIASAAAAAEAGLDEIDREMARSESRKRARREKPPPAPTRSSPRKHSAAALGRSAAEAATHGVGREVSRKGARNAPAEKPPEAPKEKPKRKGSVVVNVAGGVVAGDDDVCAEEPDTEEMDREEEEEEAEAAEVEMAEENVVARTAPRRAAQPSRARKADAEDHFVGEPVPDAEAKKRWPERYQKKGSDLSSRRADEEGERKAKCHYWSAMIDDFIYDIGDDVYVKAGPGEADYIGRITEFFEGTDHISYFTCQWFFRPEDTVISIDLIKNAKDHKHDPKRVFLSEEKNDNMLDCIVAKIKIIRAEPNIDPRAKAHQIPDCDLYYDMSYSVAYSTFAKLQENKGRAGSETASSISSDDVSIRSKDKVITDSDALSVTQTKAASLLDLYSGCGGMSTGICLGANLSGLNLETRWAVDLSPYACESLKYNHPHTEVRNEKADDFLALLHEWEKLCEKYDVSRNVILDADPGASPDDEDDDESVVLPEGVFEVEKLVGVCYGDPCSTGKVGLKFKVRWKGYGPADDTWEPTDGLGDCLEKIKEFVERGYRQNILPLPGAVDVICGGPPCQGISGFNRFRNKDDPLKDEKNKQMVVFMDIVEYLKPKYVLMENVVDILKFADGFLGRYALSRLVSMNYQARLGMMAAGCYGLPQFRMRVFLWGALPSLVLPKYPLPTHDVVIRGGVPNAFMQNVVAYDETQERNLKKALLLGDAISDLPEVGNYENNDVMEYDGPPKTEFQHYIRLSRNDMLDHSFRGQAAPNEGKLFDHQPLRLNDDDHERVKQIPVKKGANFRDLPGVKVGPNNIVEWDPEIPRVFLKSGKPLVPDYAMTFIKGRSVKPFGRLWWDETVPTVVTRAEPHNQVILHPCQARVLTIRENARLQGFPDYYRMFGPIKQRYIQVGNAVAVPVARALGYSLGLAFQGESDGKDPDFVLPQSFTCTGQATVGSASRATTPVSEVAEG